MRRSAIERLGEGQGATLALSGHLTFVEAADIWKEVRENVEAVKKGEHLAFDMSRVEAVDGGTMALLVQKKIHLRGELAARGVVADFVGATKTCRR